MITTLLSFPGAGLQGLDGSVADYRETLGLSVQEDITNSSKAWECLLVVDHQNTLNKEENDRYTTQIIIAALKLHKNVVCAKRINTDECESLSRIATECSCSFVYLPSVVMTSASITKGAMERLHSFYILFGSVVTDPSSMETCYICAEELAKAHRVSIISTEENPLVCDMQTLYPILHSSLSDVEKIYKINRFLSDLEQNKRPEIVLLHMTEPVLAFDDVEPNGFGIIPFLLSKSMPTDLFICSVPFSIYSETFVETLSSGILGQNGYPVDGISLSNMLVDSSGVVEREHVSKVYVKNQVMEEYLCRRGSAKQISAYNVFNPEGKGKMVSDIEEHYNQFLSQLVFPR